MAVCGKWHKEIDPSKGHGKCSVPMWSNSMPAGFCDQPAYGKQTEKGQKKYGKYVPYLACRFHGGPSMITSKNLTVANQIVRER